MNLVPCCLRRLSTANAPNPLASKYFSPTLVNSKNREILAMTLRNHPNARLLAPGERLEPLSKLPKQGNQTQGFTSPSSITVCSGFSPGSSKRLNFIAQMVRGMAINDAILQLTFSKKKAARKLLATIVRARAKAKAHNMPTQRLILKSLSVGRGRITKEIDIKGRGRHGIIKHYQSQVTVTLAEPDYECEFRKIFRLPKLVEHRSIQAAIDY